MILIFFASSLPGPSLASSYADEMFKPSPEPGLGYLGYTAYPMGNEVGSSPGLVGMQTDVDKKVKLASFCKSTDDPHCSFADYFQYVSAFGFCKTEIEFNCINEVFAQDLTGKKLQVNVIQSPFTPKNGYLGNSNIGLPPGSAPPLVEIPEAPHTSGTTYLPLITSFGSWDKVVGANIQVENVNLSLYAVKMEQGNYSTSEMSDQANSYFQRHWRNGNGSGERCIFNDARNCAVAEPFPTDFKFGLEIRVDKNIKGWFHGRIEDPVVSFEEKPAGFRVLRVLAKPIKVPSISVWKSKSDLPKEATQFYDGLPKPLGGSGSGASMAAQSGPPENWSLMRINNTGFGQNEMQEFLTWLPIVGDKATFLPSTWNLKLMTEFNNSGDYQSCQGNTGELVGIVSTNATQYLSGPPAFNASTNELEYKVAAPHLIPNGDVFRGSYDLTLKSSVARCLYGLSGSSFKVSISVVSDRGQLIDASTTVVEKDGWFYFSARGFTFSSPTIRVKLTPDTPAQNSTQQVIESKKMAETTVVPKEQRSKRITITCVKGKLVKKITGTNPKCAKNYTTKSK